MADKKHTLEDLFSDTGPFDEAVVIKAIQPFVVIQKATKGIFLKEGELTTPKKILVYGLAKKLLRTKGLIDEEMITAIEVSKNTGIKKGSIDPAFKDLKDKGLLVGKKEYEIPVHKIMQIINLLNS